MSNPNLPDDDHTFFRQAMKGVKRTNTASMTWLSRKRDIVRLEKSIPVVNEVDDSVNTILSMLSDPYEQRVGMEDKLFFSRSGLQEKQLRKLVSGKLPPSDYLDLHQMTVEQARLAVVQFLLHSREAGYRCVRVIHGKGQLSHAGSKLKNHINFWLQQIPWVLAFSSAQSREGGTGAVYVLLRRIRGL